MGDEPMTDQPRIMTAKEVAAFRKRSSAIDGLPDKSVRFLCASHEAQRQQMAALLTWVRAEQEDDRAKAKAAKERENGPLGAAAEANKHVHVGRASFATDVLAEAARLWLGGPADER